jgi:hypothetical protein
MISEPYLKPALSRDKSIGLDVTCAVLILCIFAVDLYVPLGVAVVILYIGIILLAFNTRHRAFIVSLTIAASMFTLFPLFHKAPVDDMWKPVVNRLMALIAIWVEGFLGLQRLTLEEKREVALSEREKALEEVRVLRGFLPICASCKRIRSMEGSWTMLEKYISEHSEAEFSHGLCPECTKKLFPQFFDEYHRPNEPK